jgi:hypothetical protein
MTVFDFNAFKKQIKQWMLTHPEGSVDELSDYCEDLIPPQHYAANQWLIEQTTAWYRHILDRRAHEQCMEELGDFD